MSIWYAIPPANYLETMEDWPYHMIIAPHLLSNDKYYDFYLKNVFNLHTIIDNGLWEGQVVSNTKLLNMANYCECEEIIAPDEVSGPLTINKTSEFIKYLKKKGQRYDFRIHGVVHGKKGSEIHKCLQDLLDLDVDVISLPKMLGPRQRDIWRKFIQKNGCMLHDIPVPVHYLGYYKEESKFLREYPIRSFDTSVPFKPRYGEKFELNLPYTLRNRIIISNRIRKWKKIYHT